LRRDSTDAERVLWRHLKDRRLEGLKFRRQHPVGPYIVDFVCPERQLIIEVDGGQHADSVSDEKRDAALQARGFRVLRFWNPQVLKELEGVLTTIALAATAPHPDPLPASRGEGE
jgi:very-short-patch-repair endonuclease